MGRRHSRWAQLCSVVATLVMFCGSVACAAERWLPVDSAEVNGPGTLGMSLPDHKVKGLIVYFHGMDQLPTVIRESRKHRALFDPLMEKGYAVVAAEAGGSSFGNPQSQEDYRQLIAAARSKYDAEPKLFVAESMGALAALALLAEDKSKQVTGLIGITPLMGLPPDARATDYIVKAWPGGVPPSADPMTWPPDVFADRAMLLYEAIGDDIIPPGGTAQDFLDRFGTVANVEVVQCGGGHVSADCYDMSYVATWLTSLGAETLT